MFHFNESFHKSLANGCVILTSFGRKWEFSHLNPVYIALDTIPGWIKGLDGDLEYTHPLSKIRKSWKTHGNNKAYEAEYRELMRTGRWMDGNTRKSLFGRFVKGLDKDTVYVLMSSETQKKNYSHRVVLRDVISKMRPGLNVWVDDLYGRRMYRKYYDASDINENQLPPVYDEGNLDSLHIKLGGNNIRLTPDAIVYLESRYGRKAVSIDYRDDARTEEGDQYMSITVNWLPLGIA